MSKIKTIDSPIAQHILALAKEEKQTWMFVLHYHYLCVLIDRMYTDKLPK